MLHFPNSSFLLAPCNDFEVSTIFLAYEKQVYPRELCCSSRSLLAFYIYGERNILSLFYACIIFAVVLYLFSLSFSPVFISRGVTNQAQQSHTESWAYTWGKNSINSCSMFKCIYSELCLVSPAFRDVLKNLQSNWRSRNRTLNSHISVFVIQLFHILIPFQYMMQAANCAITINVVF